MNLSVDMKKQLMEMAGIKDMKEFDAMAEKVAGSANKAINASQVQKRESPFQGNNRLFLFINIFFD